MRRLTGDDGLTLAPPAHPWLNFARFQERVAERLRTGRLLLVGDSLGQVVYGLPSTVPVTLEMMSAHGAAVVRGSYHAVVIVDVPFGSYEASPEQAFASAARLLKETGAAGVKMEGGEAMAAQVRFLSERGIPVMGHVGLTPQAVNMLGGYGARGRTDVPRIVDWYMDGKIEIDPMITHTMLLAYINRGFDLMHAGESIRSVVIY